MKDDLKKKVVPIEKNSEKSGHDSPILADATETPDVVPGEEPKLAEFSIALSLMQDGRVQFLRPELPCLREANDEDILSLLERGIRQLERMITISTIRGSINEGMQSAANIGAMSAIQTMTGQAKAGRIITPS